MAELALSAVPAPAPAPLLPPLALAVSIACVAGAGALANCALLAALLLRLRNGLFSIIIQLAISDIILLGTSIAPDIWTFNARTWIFGSTGCVAYQGLNVFTSTASQYLILAIALHTLATVNLEEKAARRRIRRDGDEDEEMRSSQHSLVANSDSSTPPRTMNVDYRLADTRIPVTLPTVFVWVLAASLSVPEFALASIVHMENVIICTLDSYHRFNMHSMLTVFNFFLPMFIMSTASALIIGKLKSRNKPLVVDNYESVAALKLSLWLIIVYVILCAPRIVFNAYSIYSSTGSNAVTSEESHWNLLTDINLALSSSYLVATIIRPILIIVLLPQLRSNFSFGPKNSNNV